MTDTWKPYIDDRQIKHHTLGYVIITPVDIQQSTPLGCSICDCLMRSREDDVSFREFECCYKCAMTWAHSRRKEWAEGWRPSREQVTNALSQRTPLSVAFETD